MLVRIFLVLNVFVWLPYGIYCLLDPTFLEASAGVAATSATGTTELRAMYGGLQAAVGVLAACGIVGGASMRRVALTSLCALPAGLAVARLAGVLIDGDPTSYTLGALGFETVLVICSALLLRQEAYRVLAS